MLFYINLTYVFKISLKCASLILWPHNCMNKINTRSEEITFLKISQILSIKSSIKYDNTNKCCLPILNLKLRDQINFKL